METILTTAITSFISCAIGLMVSLIPIKRMLDNRFEKATKEAEKRKDFELRRDRISRGAISSAGKAFFWLERGCKDHDPKHWNGELHSAIDEYKAIEEELKGLDEEIIQAFKSEHS